MLAGRVIIDEDIEPTYLLGTKHRFYTGVVNGIQIEVLVPSHVFVVAEIVASEANRLGTPTTLIEVLEIAATRVFWRGRVPENRILGVRLTDIG